MAALRLHLLPVGLLLMWFGGFLPAHVLLHAHAHGHEPNLTHAPTVGGCTHGHGHAHSSQPAPDNVPRDHSPDSQGCSICDLAAQTLVVFSVVILPDHQPAIVDTPADYRAPTIVACRIPHHSRAPPAA